MNNAVNAKSAYITAQFNHALLDQLAILVIAVIIIAIVATVMLRKMTKQLEIPAPSTALAEAAEPSVRKFLRIGFGALWIVDGLLQLQPQMPIGLPTQVVTPTVASAPHWVVNVVTFGTDAWLRHPVLAASATVWLQLGLGIWLLMANRGWWSRSAGWVSAAWAISVWIFGNGFGGLFVAPISWMTGAPGAVLFYALAGVAIGLAPQRLTRPLFALWAARLTAIGLAFFALLQAWPGRGYWNGDHGQGSIPAMAQSMGSVSQPGFAVHLQHWFATFTTHYSWLYNAVVVIVLAGTAVCFFTNRLRLMRWATVAYVVVALINWALVQDFAVFGGVGTDVNSMIPSSLFIVAVYLCGRGAAARSGEEVLASRETRESVLLRQVAAAGAITMFLLGAVPMAMVGVLSGTSSEVAAAYGPGVQNLDSPAPNFTLTNQDGSTVSLRSLRGKTVVMAFLDPVCTSDCPIEAQQMRIAGEQLGAGSNTVFVAVNTNPLYRSRSSLQSFTRNEGLAGNPSWYFLTGSTDALQGVWSLYGVDVQLVPGGGMVAHTEPMYVIDASGNLRSTWTAVTAGGTSSSLVSQSGTSLIVAQVKAAQS
jgi:cytochrome oxidase Cu insertion factor (SCO1/SenC/PrrC family)